MDRNYTSTNADALRVGEPPHKSHNTQQDTNNNTGEKNLTY